jgi:hypothetical protein
MGISCYKIKLTLVSVYLTAAAHLDAAQINNTSCFYRHFTGKIDTAMSISLDLLFDEGKISGSYYYYFPEPGNSKAFHYGKTIPVHGFMDGNNFSLTEFGEKGSRFFCTLENKNVITGTWQRKDGDRMIPISLKEDYSNGSLPFTCHLLTDRKFLRKGKSAEKNSPEADIRLVLLFPSLSGNNQLKDSLHYLITKFFYFDTVPFSDPESLLQITAAGFFRSYATAFDGVKVKEYDASFYWEKAISMEICYNERNISSIKIDKRAYTGGDHGIMITQFIVCDLKGKRHLQLKNVMQEDYEGRLNQMLNEKIRKLNGISPHESMKAAGFFEDKIGTSDNFYINKDGIGFFYNLYHIAPFSAGTTELFFTFSELREILNPDPSFFWNQKGDEISSR